jgi:predicted short-subunit dehydrogenase-like oxidoreductase (DUF2520 family)|tara:strand:+ start:80821 stop:81585 length:765 start_codon:yes stop_codon:yes gene_type:complete
MIDVVLLGYGNVGQHLYSAFEASSAVNVVQVYNRNPIKNLKTPQTQELSSLQNAAVSIIAIPDDEIAAISEALPVLDTLVVHTSGGVTMKALSSKNKRGVFYPLQTFSKNRSVDFKNIPICIEAENEKDLKLLQSLGKALSENVVEITSEARSTLHLAAVFVNNFVNHLYTVASEISAEQHIDFNLLKPLIAETAKKIESLSPSQAQTGPAKRNDTNTIQKHLDLLKDTGFSDLYTTLTQSIQQHIKHTSNQDQ